MIKIYDQYHKFLRYLSPQEYSEMKITEATDSGATDLSFKPLRPIDIKNEYYIRTPTDEFVVKETPRKSGQFGTVYAQQNLEGLESVIRLEFSGRNETLTQAANKALTGTGWTLGTVKLFDDDGKLENEKTRSYDIAEKNALDILLDLANGFIAEPEFDTLNRKVSFYSKRGSYKGAYLIKGLNLRELDKKSNSYDYYTRIYPYGKTNEDTGTRLSIASVNNGKEYLENFTYSDKVKPYIWSDDSYEDASTLLHDAKLKLKDLAKPEVSYSCKIFDLAKQSEEYKALDFSIGDEVDIIDPDTGTKDRQRIKKITRYPLNPEKNTCELSNIILSFEEFQKKYKTLKEKVDRTVGSSGLTSETKYTIQAAWKKYIRDGEYVTDNDMKNALYDSNKPGTCESKSDTKVKDVYFDDWNDGDIEKGQRITVYFEKGNTADVPQLRVNGGAIRDIHANGHTLSGTDPANWAGGSVIDLVYNGYCWEMASSNVNDIILGWLKYSNQAYYIDGKKLYVGSVTSEVLEANLLNSLAFKKDIPPELTEEEVKEWIAGFDGKLTSKDQGMIIDLEKGFISAGNWYISSSGEAKFTGEINATKGKIKITNTDDSDTSPAAAEATLMIGFYALGSGEYILAKDALRSDMAFVAPTIVSDGYIYGSEVRCEDGVFSDSLKVRGKDVLTDVPTTFDDNLVVNNSSPNFTVAINGIAQGALVSNGSVVGIYHMEGAGGNSGFLCYWDGSQGVFNTSSDARKKNIHGTTSDQETRTILEEIKVMEFDYKNDARHLTQSGFIAQDVRDILRENGIGYRSILTIETVNGPVCNIEAEESEVEYGIDYSKFVPYLLRGWQMHNDGIQELLNDIRYLKEIIREQNDRISSLEEIINSIHN